MKKINLLLGASLLFCGLASAQSNYYWANGKKVFVEKSDKKYVLMDVDESGSSSSRKKKPSHNIEPTHQYVNKMKGVNYKSHAYTLKSSTEATTSENIVYEGPTFKDADGNDMVMTNFFYVQLKSKGDLKVLKSTAAKYKATIIGSNSTDDLWYLLSCLESDKNPMELANTFYETGLFASAEPELVTKMKKDCYTDPMFTDQWSANNTGQYGTSIGPDINLCEAHQMTTGSNVIVSVFDEGVQYGHPDMPNLTSVRVFADFSAADGVNGDHGMQCAGIIGAQGGNGIGMVGVAPGCQIMPSAIVFDGLFATWPWGIASVVNLTWQNGADVISNSWSRSSSSSVITSAYQNALNNGRNGLGCVVVFSAGNNNANGLNFPARSDDRIITVGALSPCGERKSPSSCDGEGWGSNYGTDLDVMAPGVKIPTVNLNGTYNSTFNGTSSAAPHVAGVAALILSVDPTLTEGEVRDIIESTTQKVGGYSYQSASGRANGTWNNEMGYGLIDAEAAVIAANPLFATYNVPSASGIPTGFRKFSNVHTIGTGGPDLSNVFNSVLNWWGSIHNPNGLHQFTLETNNGQPRSYTNIPDYGSYSILGANAELSINSSIGFPGLEGDYWVNTVGNDIVLVSKTGEYAIYFSNSSTAPSVKLGDFNNEDLDVEMLSIAPNPFNDVTTIRLTDEQMDSPVKVYNSLGVLKETIIPTNNVLEIGQDYVAGTYFIHIDTPSGVVKQMVVKL